MLSGLHQHSLKWKYTAVVDGMEPLVCASLQEHGLELKLFIMGQKMTGIAWLRALAIFIAINFLLTLLDGVYYAGLLFIVQG